MRRPRPLHRFYDLSTFHFFLIACALGLSATLLIFFT